MRMKNFVSLMMSAVGGILFAIGMCMCLVEEWNAFRPGIILGCAGGLVLLAMLLTRRKMEGKPLIQLNAKAIGTVLFGIVGALALGVGMCMVMVWEGLLVFGILVGVVGILLLLGLIPLCRGLRY